MIDELKTWQKVCVFLTRRCQYRCRGCNVINYKSNYELSTEEWKKAFDIFKGYDVGFVVLFGGEPTLRDDLPELVTYLNKIKLPHTVITNSVRLNNDERYYKRLMKAKPYGISVSINVPKTMFWSDFHDDIKSQEGWYLLEKLKKDKYSGDLVANMAITKENLHHLLDMVRIFTDMNVWSILSLIHLCKPHEGMYWWYRGIVDDQNKHMLFNEHDREELVRTFSIFVRDYDKLKLHNSKRYFKELPNQAIKLDWRCSYFTCPAVNPDGSFMGCIDRPLLQPINIFDLPAKEKELYQQFEMVRDSCTNCFWDHMWETNMYAHEQLVETGKKIFQHKERSTVE